MDTNQQVAAMEQDEGDEYSKANFKQPNLEDLGEFQQIVAMPKQMVLITLIAKEPAIFNPKHDDYRNPLKKDDLWTRIAKRVGWTDKYCKNKWKAMRDQYCRELKRARTNSNVVIKWKYFQHLEFLRPYALYRNYRPKMSTRSHGDKDSLDQQMQQEDSKPEQQPIIKNDNFSASDLKAEEWNTSSYSNSSQMNDSTDITSQIMDQLSQSENNEEMNEVPQDDDDEDDDPIHTFLNIESYFEEELITMIQSAHVLYNSRHPSYRNAQFKLSVWEEIARKLKKTVRQCRLKWKALRDQYMREHKRLIYMAKVHGKNVPRWKHYDALSFLEKFTRSRSSFKCNSIKKPEIDGSSQNLDDSEQLPATEEDQEMSQYILQNDDNAQVFADCGHPGQGGEEEQPEYIESSEDVRIECTQNGEYPRDNNKHNGVPSEEASKTPAAAKDDNDEVGAFFRAIAIKIRKANMSDIAFTELQIDILRVITTALRDH